jgi:hypothetical protein
MRSYMGFAEAETNANVEISILSTSKINRK